VKGYMKYPMLILIFYVIHWIWTRHLTCVFCFFSVFAAMAQKVTNDWKDHGRWIMAEAAQMPMLWITTYAVVEGQHWSALGKVFGQILSITPLGTDSLIFTVPTEGIPSPKIRLQRRLLFAPIPRICLEA
jgi:hypothetical protein